MKKRLFVALDLPESIRERLARLCTGLPSTRWVAPDQLHLTLSFIGEVDGDTFHDLSAALIQVVFDSFPMRLDGLGFFPPRGKPRVVWVGIEKNEPLLHLQRKIHTHLVRLRLPLESRKFAPHITLARLKNTPADKVGAYLETNGLFCTEPFQVDRFRLYSSVLSQKGALHYIEQEYLAEE